MYHIPDFGEKRLKHPLVHYKLLIIFLPFPFTFKIINSRTLGLFCFPCALTHSTGGTLRRWRGCFSNAPLLAGIAQLPLRPRGLGGRN